MASALPPSGGGDAVPTAGAKGDVGHLRFPMSPLDTPLTFRWPLSEAFAAKRGLRGLGSVRRAGFGKRHCPEFALRKPPRIAVRGQTVQGGSVPLRKSPLLSMVYSWSTKRICGPLAFRRATEGSRVRGKMWGCQEGDKKPGGCLGPLLPPPPGGGLPHAMSWRTSPVPGGPLSPAAASRRIGGRSTVSRRLKSNGLLPQKSKNLPVSREVLNIYVSNRISVFGAALSVQYACRAAAS